VAGGYARPVIQRFVTTFGLSKRETEAIALASQGLKAKEIAGRMRCSEPTVYGHLSRICTKTGCCDYHEVVAKLFAFACRAVGHTPPDHRTYRGRIKKTVAPL
jgi:DNA-binding CsgD family transcriptional regulator